MDKALQSELQKIEVPQQAVEQAVLQGAKQYRRKQRRKRNCRLSIVSVAVIILCAFTVFRASPQLASGFSKIPFLAPIIEMTQPSYSEKDYTTVVNASVEKDGYTLKVKEIIADYATIRINYTLTSTNDNNPITIDNTRIENKIGLYESNNEFNAKKKQIEGYIRVVMHQPNHANEQINLIVTLEDGKQLTLPLTIKKLAFSKHYAVNKAYMVDGQKILVDEIAFSGITTTIKLSEAKNNSANIFNYNDIQLRNEFGTVITDAGATTLAGDNGESQVIVLTNKPNVHITKNMSLRMADITALPKESSEVTLVRSKNQLKSPKDMPIELKKITANSITIRYKGSKENRMSTLFNAAVEADGTVNYVKESTAHNVDIEGVLQENTYVFDSNFIGDKITLPLVDATNILKGEINIELDD